MSKFAINPPNTPMVNSQGLCSPEWYRYFVAQRKQGDDVTDSDILTIGPAQETYPNSRALAVTAGELTKTTDDALVTLGLADTAVAPATYGAATKLIVLAIDAKGRVTSASEVTLNSDNVAEGATNLFFTEDRARQSISAGSGIAYNSGTGVISLNAGGFSGTVSPVLSITVNNGIVTAVS